eukprot:sb/3467641/
MHNKSRECSSSLSGLLKIVPRSLASLSRSSLNLYSSHSFLTITSVMELVAVETVSDKDNKCRKRKRSVSPNGNSQKKSTCLPQLITKHGGTSLISLFLSLISESHTGSTSIIDSVLSAIMHNKSRECSSSLSGLLKIVPRSLASLSRSSLNLYSSHSFLTITSVMELVAVETVSDKDNKCRKRKRSVSPNGNSQKKSTCLPQLITKHGGEEVPTNTETSKSNGRSKPSTSSTREKLPVIAENGKGNGVGAKSPTKNGARNGDGASAAVDLPLVLPSVDSKTSRRSSRRG